MRHDAHDDPLKELETALRVTPSPDFAARVRERVRQQPASRWAFAAWFPLAAGAMAILVAVGAGTIGRTRHGGERAIVSTAHGAVAAEVPGPTASENVRSVAVPVAVTAEAARDAVRRAAVSRHESEVLVPSDERQTLDRLLLAVRAGRAAVPAPGVRVLEDADGHLLEPRAIEIPLLKSIEPLPGTPADGSGSIKK